MTVGNRVFSGKGAREEAGKALTYDCAVMARRFDASAAGELPRISDPEPGQEKRRRAAVAGPLHQGGRATTPRISIPRIRSARSKASSTRCARSTSSRCRRRSAKTALKRRWPTIRPRRTGRSSTNRASRNCSPAKRNSTPPLISTRASGKRPNPQTASLRSRPNSPPPP